jgi:hypothetical protein
VVQDELEQAALHGAGFGLERQRAIALDPIGDVEPDIAAAIERRQDLQPAEQQAKASAGEPPIVVGCGMAGL